MMQYKVGDKVVVGNINMDDRYKGEDGMRGIDVAEDMLSFIGDTVTIHEVREGYYRIKEDRQSWMWTITMFDGPAMGQNGTYRDWENTLRGAI